MFLCHLYILVSKVSLMSLVYVLVRLFAFRSLSFNNSLHILDIVVVQSLRHVCFFCNPMEQPTRLLCAWGFPSQEYYSGLSFLSPAFFPDPGIKAMSPAWQADSLPLSHLGSPYFRLQSLIIHIFGKYFLPVCALPSHSVYTEFCSAEDFNVNEVSL